MISPKIVGGTAASISDVPWQVGLRSNDSSTDYDAQFCGGSLISSTWIVTAAHCVSGSAASSLRVLAGVTTLSTSVSGGVGANLIIVHPSWNSSTEQNDIALIRLSSPLTLRTGLVEVIALPSSKPAGGSSAVVSGWGSTVATGAESPPSYPTGLRKASIGVFSDASCSVSVGSDFRAASMLCAGTNGYTADTCQGDSGGPLAVLTGGRWTLGGITSWGSGCAWNEPGVYTNTFAYVDWIKTNAGLTSGPSLTSATPLVWGESEVGVTLTALPGIWGPAPVSLTYQWKKNGIAITGAIKSTYTLAAGDAGGSVSVSVTGTKTGYSPATSTSVPELVSRGSFRASPRPTIAGVAQVGVLLSAQTGSWVPTPGLLSYKWFRNGVAISLATTSTYRLTTADRGKVISVQVTGAKSGYVSVVRRSPLTGVVSG